MPGGGALAIGVTMTMQRSWGHPVAETTLAMVVSGVWNNFVKLGLPVVALGLLALNGEAGPGLAVAAVIGMAVLVVVIGAFALLLRSDQTAAVVGRSTGVAVSAVRRIFDRPPVTGWDARAVGFRGEVVALLSRRWMRITVTSLVSHLSLFLVLLLALRHVGVSNEEVSWQLVLAAFAFVRLVSAIPITPGGLGLVELGLTASLGAGLPESTRNQIAAAVLALPRPHLAAADPARHRVLGVLAGQHELAPRRDPATWPAPSPARRQLSRWSAARLGRGLVLVAVGVVVALHVVRPELDPLAHRLSDYANGDHGWLMAVAFAVMAAARCWSSRRSSRPPVARSGGAGRSGRRWSSPPSGSPLPGSSAPAGARPARCRTSSTG